MGNQKIVELNIPRTAAERVAWKCCGCGMPYPDRVRRCDCATNVLSRGNRIMEYETKLDRPEEENEQLRALRTAISHIEHMAAWIGKQNAGYSFESLGEDMPGIRAALPDASLKTAE